MSLQRRSERQLWSANLDLPDSAKRPQDGVTGQNSGTAW